MRIFIVIVVASLIPVGLWTAGCRQENRQAAAFPETSEMADLAKAPDGESGSARPPVIRPAKIDKGILNLPEAPTLARVNAVNDRSRQIARADVPADLFSLDERDDRSAMAAPASAASASASSSIASRPASYKAAAAPAGIAPMPSAREFWSRPVAPLSVSESASAPSGARRSLASDISAMAAPARPVGELVPESVPGVFMGEAETPTEARQTGGLFTLNLDGLIGKSPAPERPASASTMPGIDPSIVVQSIPGDYEPLPEPIPIEEYQRLQEKELLKTAAFSDAAVKAVDAPAAASVAASVSSAPEKSLRPAGTLSLRPPVASAPVASVIPASGNALMAQPAVPPSRRAGTAKAKTEAKARTKSGAETASAKAAALAPLPDIAGSANIPAKDVKKDAKDPEAFAAKHADADIFRLDIPESKPNTIDRMPIWVDTIPEIKEPVRETKIAKEITEKKVVVKKKSVAPKKITLKPISRRDRELGKIDSEAEAPPLKF